MNITEFCIDRITSVRDALFQLNKTAMKILFVVDQKRLVAVLTDGDVRRFLLAGGKIDATVDMAANHQPIAASSREQARELLKQKCCFAIPVINTEGELIDIYFENEGLVRGLPQLRVPVVIMAGGKGTRLDPYTRVLPKPLIPIGDLPVIEHIMKRFIKYGCDDFHVVVNYKKQLIKAYFNENEQYYKVSWYDEDKPLGTGGGLYLLKGKIDNTFFLTNCDVLLLSEYDDMLRFHRKNNNAVTMVCAYKNLTIPYGVIEVGKDGTIESMKEKPEISFLTNTGMYIVEPEVLNDIENNIEIGFPDIIAKQMRKGRRVSVYPVSDNEWLDMGQLTGLEKMRERLYGE